MAALDSTTLARLDNYITTVTGEVAGEAETQMDRLRKLPYQRMLNFLK